MASSQSILAENVGEIILSISVNPDQPTKNKLANKLMIAEEYFCLSQHAYAKKLTRPYVTESVDKIEVLLIE